MCVYVYVHVHVSVHVHVDVFVVFWFIFICEDVLACRYICAHVYTMCIYVCGYICIFVCIHTLQSAANDLDIFPPTMPDRMSDREAGVSRRCCSCKLSAFSNSRLPKS